MIEQAHLHSPSLLAENRANNVGKGAVTVDLRYCLYARKSSEDDERQALSINSQIHEMQELATREGLQIVEIRRESHSAKDSGQRPEFNRLMADIDAGAFNAILTWAPDRLSRNAGDLGMLVDLMDKGRLHGIRTHSQKFTNSPNEKFLLMILGSQAKLENDNRGINVVRGLKNKVEMGWRPGVPPIGYDNEKSINRGQNRVFLDAVKAPIIKEMFERVGYQGWTGHEVEEWFEQIGFKSRTGGYIYMSMIYSMLKNPFYYGEFEYPKKSGKWYKGAHDAIIEKELFTKVQIHLSSPERPTYGKKEFMFTKMFTCGACGSVISCEEKVKRIKGDGSLRRYVYYRCGNGKDYNCKEKPMREQDILEQLLQIIDKVSIDEIGAKKQIEQEIQRYERFSDGVLGKKITIEEREASVRNYAKYILKEGANDAKRELLDCLRSKLTIKDRRLFLL